MIPLLLLIVLGFVALTSLAGGLAMALGSWLGPEKLGLPVEAQVPLEYLNGSPFSSFVVPGLSCWPSLSVACMLLPSWPCCDATAWRAC
ncbi:hypothetical protein [[Arthrobacter] sp. ATCC 21022]|uniref:hypothetical protein n=1 Tax=[Arthrobacter] sp. ATCC 21022 TaxID=1771959 RepID=UPI00074D489F|nr:hypothetical protein AUT26_09365 [Arthrobacter sp. ATCC 21022]